MAGCCTFDEGTGFPLLWEHNVPPEKGENLGTLDSFRHWIGCMQAEKDARQITQLEVHVISSQTKQGLLIGLCMLCRAK